MSFEDTPEYKQSVRMRGACDDVLCSTFCVRPSAIKRFDKDDKLFILDQEFAIDVILTLPNGTQITGQEKALTHQYYKYRTFTVEFYQNRNTKEPGEFFKIASQFYLHGYSDDTGYSFIEWKIINILELINWLKFVSVTKLEERVLPSGGSRASFLQIKYDLIPNSCILYQSGMPKNDQLQI